MTFTIVESVERWYADNSERLSPYFQIFRVRSKDSGDAIKGKVVIEFDSPRVLGSVTFWNDRNVTALAVEKRSGTERVLDDRRLDIAESITALLERYFRQLTAPE